MAIAHIFDSSLGQLRNKLFFNLKTLMMKLFAFLFSLVAFTTGNIIETVSWDSTEFDFGEIEQNIPATATYELTNNGDQPLLIKNVKVGCGCTTSNYTKEAIEPGQSTTIKATYNAKKIGKFTKTAMVYTDQGDEPTVLRLKGEVIAK